MCVHLALCDTSQCLVSVNNMSANPTRSDFSTKTYTFTVLTLYIRARTRALEQTAVSDINVDATSFMFLAITNVLAQIT